MRLEESRLEEIREAANRGLLDPRDEDPCGAGCDYAMRELLGHIDALTVERDQARMTAEFYQKRWQQEHGERVRDVCDMGRMVSRVVQRNGSLQLRLREERVKVGDLMRELGNHRV